MLIYLQAVIKTNFLSFVDAQAKLNRVFIFYKTHPSRPPILAKKTLFSRQIAAIFHLTHLLFCLFLGSEPAFCTILPFYFGCQLIIFCAQLLAFCP